MAKPKKTPRSSKNFSAKNARIKSGGDGMRLIERDNVTIDGGHITSGGVGVYVGPEGGLIPGEGKSKLDRLGAWFMQHIVAAMVTGVAATVIGGALLWYAGMAG